MEQQLTSINILNCTERIAENFLVKILGHSNRTELWNNYKDFVGCLKKEIFHQHFVIWIFGSFVTNKNPGDIDIILGVTAEDRRRIEENNDIVDFIYSLAGNEYNIHVQHIVTMTSNKIGQKNVPDWLEPILRGRDGNRELFQIDYLKHKRG